ncbi:ABC transporter permease [Prosthecomicrobium hirschii]|jgi:capsular polysaccharide transport system permease protein|nr:ABC transporter permease [Prosthecomicrobium hirschii]MCW1840029.1 ABC transporter permease [Prosthecomicrobium hirschii]TPQ48293.1 hypothetical protein C2U72_23345 [Prosthecomicrobium hirschii]
MGHAKSHKSPYGSPASLLYNNIKALFHRELMMSSRGRLGFAGIFIEPLAFIVGMSLLRYEMNPAPPLGSSMMLFFLNGVVVFYCFNRTEADISASMTKNKVILAFPVITPFDIYATEFIMTMFVMLTIYHVFLVSHNFFIQGFYPDQVIWPKDILRVYFAILMAGLYGFVLGVFNASLEVFFPVWGKAYSIVRRAQYLFSGKMFVVDYMPPTMREIIVWNPLMHPIELARSAFYSQYESKSVDLGYFFTTMLCIAVIGFALERFARKRLTTES